MIWQQWLALALCVMAFVAIVYLAWLLFDASWRSGLIRELEREERERRAEWEADQAKKRKELGDV